MQKMKKKWLLTFISIIALSSAVSAIIFVFPFWKSETDFYLSSAKKNRKTAQSYPIWGLDNYYKT